MKHSPFNSPAITYQSPGYPPEWGGRVPLKVRTIFSVGSDIPALDCIAIAPGVEVFVCVNSHGAVSAIVRNGDDTLGLRPGEFEVTRWHTSKFDSANIVGKENSGAVWFYYKSRLMVTLYKPTKNFSANMQTGFQRAPNDTETTLAFASALVEAAHQRDKLNAEFIIQRSPSWASDVQVGQP